MKLSEYIKRLQVIARQERKRGIDPEVIIVRYSDYSLNITGGASWKPAPEMPRVIELIPQNGGEWLRSLHPSMTDDDRTAVRRYVELAGGN